MTRKTEVEEMDAAFKRAAWKAVHGTREDKAGRFAPEPKSSAVKEPAPTAFDADRKPER
ncbi:MAG TPA: hypothetical protein VG735_07200 [Caulobacterales bacterium]|jgi:hypothetical protein|nr:hypothetical protein [Caulobacterales bacterium]